MRQHLDRAISNASSRLPHLYTTVNSFILCTYYVTVWRVGINSGPRPNPLPKQIQVLNSQCPGQDFSVVLFFRPPIMNSLNQMVLL